MTLTEFLTARIAEDEARVRSFSASDQFPSGMVIRKHWRIQLAECEAKRRIVEMEQRSGARTVKLDGPPMPELKWTSDGVEIWRRALGEWQRITPEEHQAIIEAYTDPAPPSMTLRLLAAVYATHPDYDPAWAL